MLHSDIKGISGPFSESDNPQKDFVPPSIAKIVFVNPTDTLGCLREQTAQEDAIFVLYLWSKIELIRCGLPISLAVDEEIGGDGQLFQPITTWMTSCKKANVQSRS